MKEYQVANFHGQTSDAQVYVWKVQGSLFSWVTFETCVMHWTDVRYLIFMENIMTPIPCNDERSGS
jgi:hypothetical protein